MSFLSFLSVGRNASNEKRLVESPDKVSAVMHAQAPGRDVTVMPAWYACFTISSPGSEIPGVPASVTSLTFFQQGIWLYLFCCIRDNLS